MKIIISPAKVQDGSFQFERPYSKVCFPKKKNELHGLIKDHTKEQMGKLMKIKNKLLDTTYKIYQEPQETKHAVNLYNGIVYKEINTNLYDDLQIMYMNEHLRILSAMYGVLEPLTGIKPYRLDMTMKPEKKNLYHYWDKEINDYFKDEVIINLASVEFSKMIKKDMINIHFKELHDDTYKIVTVRAKKARGLMVDYMITNMISDVEGIKGFDEAGYRYKPEMSDEWNLVFTME
ncbi:YaaA family protein [Acidaminobacter sp. JC074]|uniref:YaaA family protein n=1 Tax=Acidaminobacter sp. JC074 TaxID=2530199 RepID=UPI001F0D7FEA|nr:YaaA family protein [Acidaminobacter sp. JC074]MCH4890886.1 YaaA family protein [Acidaminobacter sp. JC074]